MRNNIRVRVVTHDRSLRIIAEGLSATTATADGRRYSGRAWRLEFNDFWFVTEEARAQLRLSGQLD
jgi:hypothetical protein